MVFIRIKVKGYLKNITENKFIKFEEKAIRNKNKISFTFDDTKYIIKLLDSEVILIREGKDFINTFVFNKNNSKSNYLLKDNNYDIDIDVELNNMNICDNYLDIAYKIIDTDNLYEFRIEMSDMI